MRARNMRLTLRAMAVLLGYPSAELQAHAGELRGALSGEAALPKEVLKGLDPLLRRLETWDLLDLQAEYSELFDRSRSVSLHLFEHVHGDNRDRGQAMIDLGQQYVDGGFFLEGGELPDFLPVFLEYVSCLAPSEGRETLAQPAHVYVALAERLTKRESPYAAIFHALGALAGAQPDLEALQELQEREPHENPADIDDEWEEAPVTFNATAAHEMGGPTGVVAKIRAANRASTKEAGR